MDWESWTYQNWSNCKDLEWFFFQAVQNLDIARYSNNGPFLGNGKDTTIKAMLNIEITQVL